MKQLPVLRIGLRRRLVACVRPDRVVPVRADGSAFEVRHFHRSIVIQSNRNWPARLPLMGPNKRFPIWFHFEQPDQAITVTQLDLDLLFPQPQAIGVGAAPVGQDQQPIRSQIIRTADTLPPAHDNVDRKLRRVRRLADLDAALVAQGFIDAVGHGATQRPAFTRRCARIRLAGRGDPRGPRSLRR